MMKKILLVGTNRKMASGVSTHINQLMGSSLADKFILDNFVVGSQGCHESKLNKIRRYLFSPISLATKILKYKPDIVHLNPSMDFKGFSRDAVYLLISKLLLRKVVLQLHAGLDPQVFFNRSSWLYWPKKIVLQSADVVVLLTKFELQFAEGFCNFKALKIVPNAINVEAFSIKNIKTAADRDEINLVYIGRLVDAKGLKEAVEALALLKEQGYQNLKFKIAGAGPYEQSLKKQSIDMNVQDRIEFMGLILGEHKMQFWRDADILVFPTYFEGLPYAVLEALASGTPVVTTRVGGIPEVIEDGVQGLFVEVKSAESTANAIKELISDPSLLHAMSKECITRANKGYGIERLSSQVEAIYEAL